MKKLCLILIVSLLLTSCKKIQESDFQELYITSNTIIDQNGIIIKNIHYFIDFEIGEERTDGLPYKNRLYINIEYPHIDGFKNKTKENNINELLKMIHLKQIAEDYTEVLKLYQSIMKWPKEYEEYEYIDLLGDYEIIFFTPNLLSIHIINDITYGTGLSWPNDYHLTINLTNEKILNLMDFTDINSIHKAIELSQYHIYSGETFEIANALRMNQNKLSQDLASAFKESYDKNSDYFGVDDTFIYVKFPLDFALHGYVILAIPLETLY